MTNVDQTEQPSIPGPGTDLDTDPDTDTRI